MRRYRDSPIMDTIPSNKQGSYGDNGIKVLISIFEYIPSHGILQCNIFLIVWTIVCQETCLYSGFFSFLDHGYFGLLPVCLRIVCIMLRLSEHFLDHAFQYFGVPSISRAHFLAFKRCMHMLDQFACSPCCPQSIYVPLFAPEASRLRNLALKHVVREPHITPTVHLTNIPGLLQTKREPLPLTIQTKSYSH